jgi:hypothetical protein
MARSSSSDTATEMSGTAKEIKMKTRKKYESISDYFLELCETQGYRTMVLITVLKAN